MKFLVQLLTIIISFLAFLKPILNKNDMVSDAEIGVVSGMAGVILLGAY